MSTRISHRKLQDFGLGVMGIAVFLISWEVIGVYNLAGYSWPSLTSVITFLFEPSRADLFGRAMVATFSMIAMGYIRGFFAGLAVALFSYLAPPMRLGLDRLTSTLHAIPAIALAPLFIVLFSKEVTGMALAALSVYFITYVSATSGLEASRQHHRDLFQVLGASRWSQFRSLDFPAALPSIVAGMKFAAPAAFIGTLLGEWFGASRGLGLLMVSAMQNFQIPLLWSAVLIVSATSLLAFALLSLAERIVRARFQ